MSGAIWRSEVKSTKQELLTVFEKLSSAHVMVVGDIILDRYIWGRCERISPEAPVPVVEVGRAEDRLGGAGNVVNNLRALGVQVSLCGFIGEDEEGHMVMKLLGDLGVQHDGVMVDRSRPTSVKTRVIAQSQQIVRIDREKKTEPGPVLREALAAVVDANIDSCQALIVSDYAKGTVSEQLCRKLYEAKKKGRVGLSSVPYVVDPHPENYDLYRGITMAKPNRKEAEAGSGIRVSGREDAVKAAAVLRERWEAEMMMITLGDGGLVILPPGSSEGVFLDTVAKEVFDVSGAGDTVTALFTAAMAVGASCIVAGDLANIGAGIVVSEVGTVAVDPARLIVDINRLGAAAK